LHPTPFKGMGNGAGSRRRSKQPPESNDDDDDVEILQGSVSFTKQVSHQSCATEYSQGDVVAPLECFNDVDSQASASEDSLSRIASTASSNAQYGEAAQTLIFMDWDDTIFPTSAIFAECPSSTIRDPSRDIPPSLVASLARWRVALYKFLTLACSVSERCTIITNSTRPWVHQCVMRFIPEALPLFESHAGVHVVYAGEVPTKPQRRSGLRAVRREVELKELEVHDKLTKAKLEAMQQAANTFYSKYPGQTWKNILSIGDMPYEHSAVQEMTFRRVAPARERVRTKAITVPSEPSICEAAFRLELQVRLLPAYVHHDGDLSVELEALQDHIQVLATALNMSDLASVEFPESAWGPEPQLDCEATAAALEELGGKVQSSLLQNLRRQH